MTAVVQPGNSGGPVLDGAGALLGVTVARMSDVAALVATNSVPQTTRFRHQGRCRGELSAGERGRTEDGRAAAALPTPQIAAGGKAFTAQVMCVRAGGTD